MAAAGVAMGLRSVGSWHDSQLASGEASFALESGHFTGTEARVLLTRAEGPAVNSLPREGGRLEEPESEVLRAGTSPVPHLSALLVLW